MSNHTIVRLKGYIKPEEVINFIRDKIANKEVSHVIEIKNMDYIKSGYKLERGSIFIYYDNRLEVLFYCHDNINLKENLDYFTNIGLRDMIESETTYLSMEYSDYSIPIMKQIVENFGGWIGEIDQDDISYYKVDKRGN